MKHQLSAVRTVFAKKHLILLADVYHNCTTPLNYRCMVCGFEGAIRFDILRNKGGVGCKKCNTTRRTSARKLDFQKFKAEQLGRGIVVRSTEYVNSQAVIEAQCSKCHHVLVTSANNLRSGKGCPQCGLRRRVKQRTYTTQSVGDSLAKWRVTLLSEYVNSLTPIRVRFEDCGCEVVSRWNHLHRKPGKCPGCAPNARVAGSEYHAEAKKFGGKLVEQAKRAQYKSKWRCALGHIFLRKLSTIRAEGTFCTVCSSSYSEMLCRTIVEKLFGVAFRRVRVPGMTSIKGFLLELDIYNDDLKLAVEHNGAHHYGPQKNWSGLEGFRIQRINDQRRRSFCKTSGILLIEIRELGKRISVEAMRKQIKCALVRYGRLVPPEFDEVDLANLPVVSRSQVYWNEVHTAARAMGLEILSQVFLGADEPISVRCSRAHVTRKTPRCILNRHQCDECVMEQQKKPLRLSDGRVFESGAAAAKAFGVIKEVVNKAVRDGRMFKGFRIERISWDEFRQCAAGEFGSSEKLLSPVEVQ